MTQAEIASCVGVSQMHVSRLLRRSLDRLSAAGAPPDKGGVDRPRRASRAVRQPVPDDPLLAATRSLTAQKLGGSGSGTSGVRARAAATMIRWMPGAKRLGRPSPVGS